MQSNSVNGQPDIANITVVTDERQVIVPQAITSVVEVNNPGPQGPVGPTGPQGPSVPFTNIGNDVYATTSSLQVTGSFLVSGSSTFTNIGPAVFSGSVNATSGVTMSSALVSGDVTVLGTASINVLQINTTINSTGSNQLGDNANDTQTLYGSVVIPTGSLVVTGSTIISSSAATQLQVGSNLLFVSSSGNVGIGTNTPFSPLTVNGVISSGNNLGASGGSTVQGELRSYQQNASPLYLSLQTSGNKSGLFRSNANYIVYYDTGNGDTVLNSGFSNANLRFTYLDSEKMRIFGPTGNVVIQNGGTFTDAGYRLDVSGSAKVNEGIFGIGTSGTILPLVNTAGTGTVVVGGTSPNTPALRLQGSPLNFLIGSTQVAQMFATTGNFALQSGGTFTDAGFRLDVSGSARVTGEANVSFLSLSGNTAVNSSGTTLILGASGGWTGVRVPRYFETTGSINAASAIARGAYLNQTLVATANNDILVGLDIQSTFTPGAFTGVAQIGIRTNGSIQSPIIFGATYLALSSGAYTQPISFYLNQTGTLIARFFGTTGNLLLQNGGTFTDSGARLHISGSTSEALLVASSSAGPALYVSGSGQVGIGTSTPSSSISLDVSGSIRSFNVLPAANGSYDIGVSTNRFRNGWFAGSLIAATGYFSDLFFGTTNLRIYNSTSTQVAQMFSTGDLVLQNGGTFTNNNYRLQVNATGSTNSGSLFLGGTTIATGSIARTMLISSSVSASANNDVLVGLDINPSFDAGSFTGVERTAIRFGTIKIGLTAGGQDRIDFGSQVNIQRSGENILTATTVSTSLNSRAASVPILFTLNQGITEVGRFAATTGNFLINTTIDLGYKLAVSGGLLLTSSAFNAPLVLSDQNYIYGGGNTSSANAIFGVTSTQTELYARNNRIGIWGSGGSSNYLYSVNGDFGIGIGAITPSARLHISGASSANLLRIDSPTVSGSLFVSGSGNVGIGTTTPISTLDIRGTQVATSSIARTMLISSSLSASANNDVLVGLDIQPTFTNGAFTGVTNTVLRVNGNITPTFAGNGNIGTGALPFGAGVFSGIVYSNTYQNYSSNINFSIGGTTVARLWTTSNLTLQNGGTFTDTGYRLVINSSGSLSGSLYITGSSNQTLLRVDSDASSSILFVSGSGRVGINTPTPRATTELVGTLRLTNTGDPSKFNDLATDLNGYMTIGNVVYTGGIGSNNGYVNLYQNYINVGSASGYFFTSTVNSGASTRDVGFSRAGVNIVSVNTGAEGNANGTLLAANIGIGLGMTSPSARLAVRGSGATSATTTFLLQNSTPTNLLSVLDNGQVSFTSPTMSLAASQSAFSISPIISASNIVGGQYYGVSITPTFFQTTGSQTETAFRVAATFTQSSAVATSGSNIIADFGSTSAGSQLTVTDVTSGSIYMVNDVSGIPIIEATSNWDVNIYDFPNKVFEKTGSQVNIYGTMRVSGSFILPLSQSVAPQTGSAYWSGSLLFIYNGTRYMSASFA